eukprot:1153471-Pelagomonas_calceolata.AAC.6
MPVKAVCQAVGRAHYLSRITDFSDLGSPAHHLSRKTAVSKAILKAYTFKTQIWGLISIVTYTGLFSKSTYTAPA